MENFQNYIEKKEKNKIIEIGLNIDNNFWQNFLSILNHSEGLSDLLNVSKNKVASWRKNISESLKDYENQKLILINKKEKIIKTGLPKNI